MASEIRKPAAMPLSSLLAIQHILERRADLLKRAAADVEKEKDGRLRAFFNEEGALTTFSAEECRTRELLADVLAVIAQAQAGHPRPVSIHYIVARDTADEAVILRRQKKSTVQAALLESVKGKSNARQ